MKEVKEVIVGEIFGKLTVISHISGALWLCQCSCKDKTLIKVTRTNLRKGKSTCGCYRHNKTKTPEYRAWITMKNRCNNQNNQYYHRYGGRGIKYCERWELWENFYEDMGKRPSTKHSLDRIDNNGDYTPENCRWATDLEQANNQEKNRNFTIDNKTQSVTQWGREFGFKRGVVEARINRGWSIEEALSTPASRNNPRKPKKKFKNQS